MTRKDITSRTILKNIVTDIALYLFNMPLDTAELLETQNQRIEERRADLVVKARQGTDTFILHIEIQNNNQADMPLRMMRYYTDIALCYPGYNIHQYLIYIGQNTLTMPDNITQPLFAYQYTLINMHTIDCSVFLQQNKPEAVVLTILCDFKGRDKYQVIQEIIRRIDQLTQNNSKQFSHCMLMLETLSDNRKLTPVVKEVEKMLSAIKLENLPSYEIGMEKGLSEILIHQLKSKFNTISEQHIQQISNADEQLLLKWSEQILSAQNIEDVFK